MIVAVGCHALKEIIVLQRFASSTDVEVMPIPRNADAVMPQLIIESMKPAYAFMLVSLKCKCT